jgi:hypothetical protein
VKTNVDGNNQSSCHHVSCVEERICDSRASAVSHVQLCPG